jgi:hypothetical protein
MVLGRTLLSMETVGSSVADCDPASLGFCVDICKMGQGHLLLKLSGDKTRGAGPPNLGLGFSAKDKAAGLARTLGTLQA